nr:hypothetical protein [Tanacetum cinerariifolium]
MAITMFELPRPPNHHLCVFYKFDAEKAGEEINQQYVLFSLWSSGSINPHNYDGDAAFDGKEHDFDAMKPESEVILSLSSSAQSRRQDEKTKKEAKGKTPLESFIRYRDLSAEFEDCSNNSSNEASNIEPLVRPSLMKGIKREYSIPRTPQQNGIAERKNKTLIEAARSKFERKVDEGFLVGYFVNNKAFRVFNSRTHLVQETLHVNFLENKPNIAGSGPTWLFDIDSLTRTMNYQPVTAENQTNPSAGFQDKFDAEKAGKEEHDAKKPESVVNVSPSSSAQSEKQDDKTKRKAKGKSLVESFTGNKDLSAE